MQAQGITAPEEVELFGDDREASCLGKVECVVADKVACVQQVLHLTMQHRFMSARCLSKYLGFICKRQAHKIALYMVRQEQMFDNHGCWTRLHAGQLHLTLLNHVRQRQWKGTCIYSLQPSADDTSLALHPTCHALSLSLDSAA